MLDEIQWLDQPAQAENAVKLHADLKQNQRYAKTFIERIRSSLVEGMDVKLGGSTSLPESLLWVTYRAPTGIPVGDYGYCINLNAPSADVKKTTEYYFNSYHKMAKNVLAKYSQPKIVELRQAI
jgi:hypothetical protein